MLPVDRRRKIVELLYSNGSVVVADLSNIFNVSEETIRRDLEKLENEKILKRTYGGAYLDQKMINEVPVWIREEAYKEEKEWIGVKCAKMISDDAVIILDSSTTSLYIAKKIKNNKKITVITNSLKVTNELSSDENINLICIGGSLRHRSQSFVGHNGLSNLKNYFADMAFVSCSGVDLKNGITDSNEYEAEIRKLMLQQSDYKVLIIDHTKLNKTAFKFIAPISEVNKLVTTKPLPVQWKKHLQQQGISIDDEELHQSENSV